MRTVLVLIFTFWTTALMAGDLLSDVQGQWEGKGVLSSGMEWPLFVRFGPDGAEVYTPEDGCEATWSYARLGPGLIQGREELKIGFDRCEVGLKYVVTRHDESRLEVNWFTMHDVFVAEALLWPVQ